MSCLGMIYGVVLLPDLGGLGDAPPHSVAKRHSQFGCLRILHAAAEQE